MLGINWPDHVISPFSSSLVQTPFEKALLNFTLRLLSIRNGHGHFIERGITGEMDAGPVVFKETAGIKQAVLDGRRRGHVFIRTHVMDDTDVFLRERHPCIPDIDKDLLLVTVGGNKKFLFGEDFMAVMARRIRAKKLRE